MRSRTPSSPSASIFFGRVGDLEQRARRLVDAGVGRLRRQHHGHQQREGIDVLQLALGLGVGRGKAPEDLGHPLRRRLGLPRPRARLGGGGAGPGRTVLGIGASRGPIALVELPVMTGKWEQTQAEPGAFRAVLTPHRSLGPTGFPGPDGGAVRASASSPGWCSIWSAPGR